MIGYEIKAGKKNIIILVCELILFAVLGFGLKLFPEIVAKAVSLLNKSDFIRSFLGSDDYIKSVTYEEVMFAAALVFVPVLWMRNMNFTYRSVIRESRLGTGIFFLSNSISRVRMILTKLSVAVVLMIVEMVLFGAMMWGFASWGVSHEVMRKIITEDILNVLWMLSVMAFTSLALGFLMGCVSAEKSLSSSLLLAGGIIAIMPNLIRGILDMLSEGNVENVIAGDTVKVLEKIREYDIFYICNPFISFDGNMVTSAMIYVCLAIGMVVTGVVIYEKRDIV